jgi:integrase
MAVRRRGKNPKNWQIRYDEPRGVDGRRKRVEIPFTGTKTEAVAEEARLKARSLRGKSTSTRGRALFSEFAEAWIERRRNMVMTEAGRDDEVAPATFRADQSRLEQRILPVFKDVRMMHITPDMVEDAKVVWKRATSTTRGGKTLSQKYVYHIFGLFRKMMNDAVRWRYIEDNPCEGIVAPTKGEGRLESIDIEAARVLFAHRSLEPIHVATIFDLLTGVRRGELLAIHVDDLNMHLGRVWIHRAVTELDDGRLVLKDLKTKKHGRRFIPLGAALTDLLAAYLESRPDLTGPLFKDGHDKHELWHPEAFSSRLRTHFRRLGISGSAQRLRHAFNSFGEALDVSEAVRQQLLGHKLGSAVTRKNYTTIWDAQTESFIARLEAHLRAGSEK